MWVQSRSLLGFLWELYRRIGYGIAIAGFTIARAIRLLDLIIHSLDPSLISRLMSVDRPKM